MDNTSKSVLLASIAKSQKEAESLPTKPYNERFFPAYELARSVLRTVAHISDPEIETAITKLCDTLNDAFKP